MTDYQQALETLKTELLARNDRTHKHIYERKERVSANFGDQSQEMENQELVMNLDAEGQLELRQIDAALQRLQRGEFGNCAECGEKIPDDRLKAIPFTPHCVKCAAEVDS